MSTASHFIAKLIQHNIVLVLPLLVLAFKFAIRWTTREQLKDVFKSLLTVPLDLVYIAVGLMFAALARRLPHFIAIYPTDKEADLQGAILIGALFLVAVVITLSDRGVRLCWQKAFAAMALVKDSPQLSLRELTPESNPLIGDEMVRTWVWIVIYWVGLTLLFAIECILSVVALGGILTSVT